MDDIANQLNQILSDPQSMNQIKNIMDSMGLGGTGDNSTPVPPAPNQTPTAMPDMDMINAITKFAPLISQVQAEDDTSRLLNALRPMLSEPKQKKIDEAVKIIKIMKLMPLIKDAGILNNIFG